MRNRTLKAIMQTSFLAGYEARRIEEYDHTTVKEMSDALTEERIEELEGHDCHMGEEGSCKSCEELFELKNGA